MPITKLSNQAAAKAALATALLSLLAGVAGSQLAPNAPLHLVLLYSAVGAAALFVFLILATVATLTLVQLILRKGGTDPQLFWFPAEPPGLVHLREQARQAKAQSARSEE